MNRRPVHPGEVLSEELRELGVTPSELARQIAVPANRITQIVRSQRSVSGDTALRLAHWFDMSPEFWINLQAQFEIAVARQRSGGEIAKLPQRKIA